MWEAVTESAQQQSSIALGKRLLVSGQMCQVHAVAMGGGDAETPELSAQSRHNRTRTEVAAQRVVAMPAMCKLYIYACCADWSKEMTRDP